jgi:aryl sulfotransferase
LDNILFVHYNDLKADLSKQVKRIAAFLDIEVPEAALPGLLENLSLEAMRDEAARNQPGMSRIWTEGARTFFFKGTNGRWREVLAPEEVALYDEKAAEALTPECRAWLEGGKQHSPDPLPTIPTARDASRARGRPAVPTPPEAGGKNTLIL